MKIVMVSGVYEGYCRQVHSPRRAGSASFLKYRGGMLKCVCCCCSIHVERCVCVGVAQARIREEDLFSEGVSSAVLQTGRGSVVACM